MPPAASMTLAQALALHRAGRLADADAAYRAILAAAPNPDAHYLLGVVALQSNRPDDAVGPLRQATGLSPTQPQYHQTLGVALGQSGHPAEALTAFEHALALQPDYPEALTGKANALLALGRHPEALAALDAAIKLRPNHTETIFRRASLALAMHDHAAALAGFQLLRDRQPGSVPVLSGTGVALAGLGRLDEALAAFDAAIARAPDDPALHANRALTLERLGRYAEAVTACDAALQRDPGNVAALDNRANALRKLGRLDEALHTHDRVAALNPDFAEGHNNRGATLQALHRYDAALTSHDRALARAPNNPNFHNNRATALQALDRFDEALAAYDAAVALDPDHANALSNRGLLLQMMGRPTEALADFSSAIARRPDDAMLRFNASICRLLLGDMPAGWAGFEHRWESHLMAADRRDFGRPQWRGQPGGTVLLFAEQGFGDTLQFARYAPIVADAVGQVILEVQPALVRLLRRLDPRIQVIARGDPLPDFDWQCPLMSLPLALSRPFPEYLGPYLRADPGTVAVWRTRLAAYPGRKVGLVWAGSPRGHEPQLAAADRRRSIALQQLAPLSGVPGITYVSLQKGPASGQPPPSGLSMLDFTADLTDFDDTAALVAALDLVISVDTAVVHLAGGLGVPVWILNRFDTCWRWMLGRSDSPWYATARLFRQPALDVPALGAPPLGAPARGAWDDVVASVAGALATQPPPVAGPPATKRPWNDVP